jgi:hypothetical protein
MLGLIALIVSMVLAGTGYVMSRNFTQRRLRYTPVAERPGLWAILAGLGAGLLASPVVGILPLVGAGTALLFGAGVGTGVAVGATRSRA